MLWESYYPYLIGACVALLFWLLGISHPANMDAVYSAGLTMGAVFAGFLSTVKAIVFSLKKTRLFKQLKDSGFFEDLLSYLKEGIWSALGLTIFSLGGFFAASYPKIVEYYLLFWIYILFASLLTFFRIVSIFMKILRNL